MKSVLNDLDPQAVLLMYLADELSPADRQQVERRLAEDAALREQLAELEKLQDVFQQVMAEMEQASSGTLHAAAGSEKTAAVRRASRLMHEYAVGRTVPTPMRISGQSNPWLRYGLSAAAAVGLAYLGWWTWKPAVKNQSPSIPADVIATGPNSVSQDEKVSLVLDTMDASAAEDSTNRQVAATLTDHADVDFPTDVQNAGEMP